MRITGSILLLTLLLTIGLVIADRLPNQTPENQIFLIDTLIDAIGPIESASDLSWLITSPGAITTGSIGSHLDRSGGSYFLYPGGKVISDARYKDAILTNGGRLSETKNFGFNSEDQATGLYNIESEKVLTYGTTEGAHLTGEEEFTLDVAGEAKRADTKIRCVFAQPSGNWLPPFCNIVSGKSSQINVNSAKISTKGQMRSVATTDDIPAELNYQIAVTPEENSESAFAKGIIQTNFAGSIMEGRGTGMYWTERGANNFNDQLIYTHASPVKAGDEIPWDLLKTLAGNNYDYLAVNDPSLGTEFTYNPSNTNSWKDSTSVSGGIKNLQKTMTYKSGFVF